MSSMNIQWKLSKPLGIIAILSAFAILMQIPTIYQAREILQVVNNEYITAYIVIIIAAVFIIVNSEVALYEAFLVRLRSYNIKDYRAPFLAASVVSIIYYVFYYVTFVSLNGVKLFGIMSPVARYAICQIIGLILVMIVSFWYNRRQLKIIEAL
ncbi:MAG: hypothetical protein JXA54_13675 [Candidatus Heimdallarchaeota archaeon]|nr:hypothetical protein [Candidatus Heimdallarchaeota archaeon]